MDIYIGYNQYNIVSKSINAERELIRILIIQMFWKPEKCHDKNATVSLFETSTMNARVLYIYPNIILITLFLNFSKSTFNDKYLVWNVKYVWMKSTLFERSLI